MNPDKISPTRASDVQIAMRDIASRQAAPGTVLIVDDEPGVIEQFATYLESLGHTAYGLADSRNVPDLLESINPLVSILDYHMPHLKRLKLVDLITHSSPNEQVIFLTAADDPPGPGDSTQQDVHQYLRKPVQLPDVGHAVDRALNRRRRVVDKACLKELERLVADEALALDETLASGRQIPRSTFEALAMALDIRDQGTTGHSKRVAEMTSGIAETIGIIGSALEQIRYGALLHDVGKLKIPEGILLKPGPLTANEWEIMREHPRHGFDFCSKMSSLGGGREIVYSHHEKFDGTGYPRGLRGEEIPLGARIFAVVDAVDAMISDRPYQQGISFAKAEAEVRKCSGSHFDPGVVEAALGFLRTTLA